VNSAQRIDFQVSKLHRASMLLDKKAAFAHKTNNSLSSGQVSGSGLFLKK